MTRDGKLTRAALLLLGAGTSTHLLTPHPAQMTWKLMGEQRAYEHFHPPFLLSATELASRIRNVQLRLMPPDELIYREVSKYDERSLLEAIYNCIAHQDYSTCSRIIVTEYPDRITFESDGEFFDGVPDDYVLDERTPHRYRHPCLVEAMTELHLIDQMGYGIHRMVRDQMRRFLPLPDYDLSSPGVVKLTIPGAVIDQAYSQMLMIRTDLPLDDVLALDRVQKRLDISPAAIAHLRKEKLIEGRQPHLRVSEAIAGATGKLADYVRTRPQTDAHYATLVKDFLRRNGCASRADINTLLVPLLPEVLTEQQKLTKVSNLLSKLKREGSIVNTGTRGRPRWVLV
ncbi:ATP-binding protein [Acidipropionibacterium timonense]|uniref:ATP-binding protein n=1 Tax=Acidipropionibacterium timonense TaxID=2161818 RepID=UPI001FD8E299|nr:ATP-binding protein [Acidipropionibacterium timonense]